MRQTLMVAAMAVMASCTPSGNTPWDENHDGLITACEGLNSYACDSTPGCEPVAVNCSSAALRETDGNTPCVAGTETCRPTTPPIFDCSRLSLSDCATVARCEVVTRQTACDANGGSGVGFEEQRYPAPAPPICGQAVQVCANRAPTACEQLSTDVCLAQPGCALEGYGATCDIACSSDSFNCPPCATPMQRCVTLPPPDLCGARDTSTCTLDGQCVLETADYRCDTAGVPCAPNDPSCGAPIACSPPAPRCVPAPPPDVCGSRDENTCTIDGRCVLETAVCATVCDPSGNCPPCANPAPRCVPAPVPGVCDGRDENTCAIDGQCVLIPGPECLCAPDGTCPPCASPSVMCVPAPKPDPCSLRDLNTCSIDGQCMVQYWACPAICLPDGNGGCQPCDAPPAACVPVYPVYPDPDPQPSRCAGLDRLTCAASGCEVVELECAQVCIDDGHGGCLPCKDFMCSEPSTGGSGGGTPPPQP